MSLNDIHGQAILNFYKGERNTLLKLHNSYGEPEEMNVDVFFRDQDDFTEIENTAMAHCRGSIIDIGAGAGAHSLFLQSFNAKIVALENSPGCVRTMQLSGVENVVFDDYRTHKGKYDTILLMMNGIGIIGKLENIQPFLKICSNLLNPGGQVILDSSDIGYLYADGLAKPEYYYGEIKYQYEYKGEKGNWFDWVYIDQRNLINNVLKSGLKIEILEKDNYDQYLAKIEGF